MNIVCLDSAPAEMGGDVSWDAIRAQGTLTLHRQTASEDIIARAKDAEVLLTNKVRITAETLAALPKLKLICVLATGYDRIDLEAAVKHGVTVCNVPGYSSAAAAQTTIALLLELTQGAGNHSAAIHKGEWSRQETFAYWRQPLVELDGRTMAIIGYGNIGQRVGAIAEALGMHLLPTAVPGRPASSDRVPLQEALSKADVVTLHCPLTDATRGLINAETLAWMKPGALLLNAGRGPLLDEQAVVDALESGHLGGLAADVLSEEPPPSSHPFLNAPRTVLTPHIGWAAQEARQRLLNWTAESIEAFKKGTPIRVVAGASHD